MCELAGFSNRLLVVRIYDYVGRLGDAAFVGDNVDFDMRAWRSLDQAGALPNSQSPTPENRAAQGSCSAKSLRMPHKLRPTGLGSSLDKDRADYPVHCGGWDVGRIYETRGGPDSLRRFWSMTVNGPMTRSDRVATLEEAKAQFHHRGS